MRYKLIILFSVFSLSASAQFLHISFKKKKHLVFRAIPQIKDRSLCHVSERQAVLLTEVKPYQYEESWFSMQAREKVLLKTVKHNMSWRIYNVASYNFNDLAELYIKMHRFSEAKWYLLQSNNLSRGQNDDRLTIDNLLDLAIVKERLGDLPSARADLNEAHDMAQAKGMKDKMDEINKMIPMLGQNKAFIANRYAETPDAAAKDL